MKQIPLIVLISATIFFSANAQNVGIGTNTPAASAQLDLIFDPEAARLSLVVILSGEIKN